MTANAPDASTLFNYQRACADDEAILAMLKTQEGKRLRVSPEHVLVLSATESKIVVEVKDTYIDMSLELWIDASRSLGRLCWPP